MTSMCEDDRVSIDSPEDLQAMRAAGRVVAEAIREMARRVRPGVTTAELDDVAAGVFARHGARSGPQLDYDFPGVTCISLDDEAVHGIPSSKRRIREGQLVKLDVTAELDGFYACAELTGHGIGRRIHEEPNVPNVAWDGPQLTDGLVITVEPIIAAGRGDVYVDDDGWTIRTEDRSRSAHFEHTIVVTEGAPILLTA